MARICSRDQSKYYTFDSDEVLFMSTNRVCDRRINTNVIG